MRRGCRKTLSTVARGRARCGWRTIRCQPARKRVVLHRPALIDACLGARSRRPERV
jgi:hypothetical protein